MDAARREFAAKGYVGTSLRGVARRAQVDAALVHHYFDSKAALFGECVALPVDISKLAEAVIHGTQETLGRRVVRSFLGLWDTPLGRERFGAILGAVSGDAEAIRGMREYLFTEVIGRVAREVGAPEGGAGLVAAQLVGLGIMRYVVQMPGVADASPESLIDEVGPVVDGYLCPVGAR